MDTEKNQEGSSDSTPAEGTEPKLEGSMPARAEAANVEAAQDLPGPSTPRNTAPIQGALDSPLESSVEPAIASAADSMPEVTSEITSEAVVAIPDSPATPSFEDATPPSTGIDATPPTAPAAPTITDPSAPPSPPITAAATSSTIETLDTSTSPPVEPTPDLTAPIAASQVSQAGALTPPPSSPPPASSPQPQQPQYQSEYATQATQQPSYQQPATYQQPAAGTQQQYYYPPEPRRGIPTAVWIGGGIILFLLVVGAIIALVLALSGGGTGTPTDTARSFYQKLGAHDYNGVVALLTPEFAAQVPADSWKQGWEQLEQETNAKFQSVDISNVNQQGDSATASAKVKLSDGADRNPVTITFRKIGDKWLIASIQ